MRGHFQNGRSAKNSSQRGWEYPFKKNTAMRVCGGFRCTGKEYVEIISEFDAQFGPLKKEHRPCQKQFYIYCSSRIIE